ncbi:hypothetical protein D3C87_1828300 [compost metagenome]
MFQLKASPTTALAAPFRVWFLDRLRLSNCLNGLELRPVRPKGVQRGASLALVGGV